MTRPSHARIDIVPADALIDVPRDITLRGFNAHERVTLTGTLNHPDGSQWESHAVLIADADGTVVVGDTAPVSGGWLVADATAPVWAMQRLRAPTRPAWSEGIAPLDIALTATGQYGAQARGQ